MSKRSITGHQEIVELLPSSVGIISWALGRVKRSSSVAIPALKQRLGFVNDKDMFLRPPPKLGPHATPTLDITGSQGETPSENPEASTQSDALRALLEQLSSMATVAFEKDYVARLRESVDSLDTRKCEAPVLKRHITSDLEIHLADCKGRTAAMYSAICRELNEHMMSQFMLDSETEGAVTDGTLSAHLPRLSPSFLLQLISRKKLKSLPATWKECIVKYSVSLADVQHAERMLSVAKRNDVSALSTELQNPGHRNWDPMDYPDSLLLEVESGITIRDVQEEIAARMRTPHDSENAVMQLNMGEGKSSVIVPIVASALADGSRVVRVLVAKPQSKQMLHMLTSKLGGLLDRVVFQMPFSRDLQVSDAQAHSIRRMLEQCRDVGGVLLVQPEHILSLQQIGTEYAMTEGKSVAGKTLNLTRHFLFDSARDIVDESDENFSVNFELVYTMGLQQSVDNSPQR